MSASRTAAVTRSGRSPATKCPDRSAIVSVPPVVETDVPAVSPPAALPAAIAARMSRLVSEIARSQNIVFVSNPESYGTNLQAYRLDTQQVAWTLPGDDGPKRVYLQVRDPAGNVVVLAEHV